MKRTILTVSVLALVGLASCGCSSSRPFWLANKPEAGSTDIATSTQESETGSSFAERAKGKSTERSYEGPLALARLAERAGNSVEAERLYRSIMEKSPSNATARHRLAIMLSQKGKFEEAEGAFKRALDLAPEDPGLLSDAGYNYYLQNRLDEAEPLFRRALEIQSNHEAAKNNLAMLLGERGDYRTAMKLFRETGTEPEAYSNIGYVYARRGEFAKAKEAYSHALTLDPTMRAPAEALVQFSQFEKRTDNLVAQNSLPEVHPGRPIKRSRQAMDSHVATASSVFEPASSYNRTAGYLGMGQTAAAISANTAEYNSRSDRLQALPVVYPEVIPAQ